jgi:hypothetical protein
MAKGKPAGHVLTSVSCDTCHRTTAWTPATMSHAGVAPGTCATCHNGSTAKGKGTGHFVTTRSCDACHRTTGWTPTTPYSHMSPAYVAHSAGATCANCHKSNSEIILYANASLKPFCGACHANDFKPGEHKKVSSPQILYTVTELKDCSGACHEYTDNKFTTIKKSRSGQHRATNGGF